MRCSPPSERRAVQWPASSRYEAGDRVAPQDHRAVDAEEQGRVEILLELADGAVDQPGAGADMEPHIVALGGDRGGCPTAAIRTRPLWSGTQNSSTWAEVRPARRPRPPPARCVADPLQRALEPVRVDRLHQIVDRGDVERGDREIVERGDEDDRRIDRRTPDSARATSIPSMPGHGDVEQDDVGRDRLGDPQRGLAVIGGADQRSRPRQRASSSCSRSTASGSSSTTITLIGCRLSHCWSPACRDGRYSRRPGSGPAMQPARGP